MYLAEQFSCTSLLQAIVGARERHLPWLALRAPSKPHHCPGIFRELQKLIERAVFSSPRMVRTLQHPSFWALAPRRARPPRPPVSTFDIPSSHGFFCQTLRGATPCRSSEDRSSISSWFARPDPKATGTHAAKKLGNQHSHLRNKLHEFTAWAGVRGGAIAGEEEIAILLFCRLAPSQPIPLLKADERAPPQRGGNTPVRPAGVFTSSSCTSRHKARMKRPLLLPGCLAPSIFPAHPELAIVCAKLNVAPRPSARPRHSAVPHSSLPA